MENLIWLFLVIGIAAIIIYFFFGKDSSVGQDRLEIDAKRFARLLMAEIKLYEDYKINRGLKNNNLYESLRDEIEAAKKKYKARCPQADLEKYFDDALVDVLADGDKSKLGK